MASDVGSSAQAMPAKSAFTWVKEEPVEKDVPAERASLPLRAPGKAGAILPVKVRPK
jgi:hypothetical protein